MREKGRTRPGRRAERTGGRLHSTRDRKIAASPRVSWCMPSHGVQIAPTMRRLRCPLRRLSVFGPSDLPRVILLWCHPAPLWWLGRCLPLSSASPRLRRSGQPTPGGEGSEASGNAIESRQQRAARQQATDRQDGAHRPPSADTGVEREGTDSRMQISEMLPLLALFGRIKGFVESKTGLNETECIYTAEYTELILVSVLLRKQSHETSD